MRLIDPDELERVLRPILTDESCPLHIAAEIDMNLDLMPKVDAVPVVRCCECRWWHDWNGECYAKEAQGFGHLWNADDYCSYGERKDGEQHD